VWEPLGCLWEGFGIFLFLLVIPPLLDEPSRGKT
jgi:hypothetical protein